jgi:hypothetical protein
VRLIEERMKISRREKTEGKEKKEIIKKQK